MTDKSPSISKPLVQNAQSSQLPEKYSYEYYQLHAQRL